METIAIFIAILVGVVTAFCLAFVVLGKRSRVAAGRAHARRLADARMSARLLRLDI